MNNSRIVIDLEFTGERADQLAEMSEARRETVRQILDRLIDRELAIFRQNVASHGPTGKPK